MNGSTTQIEILLVEDNPGDARLIMEMLEDGRLGGHAVETAERLEEAVSFVKSKRYDVILLDLNLPDSSGLKTLDRTIAATGGIVPVVILTGLSDEALGEALIGHGADDYLEKNDINAARLSRSVRYAMERGMLARDLRESEEIFRQFMEHCPIYVFFKDTRIRSLRLSRNYETMLARPLDELLGKTMDELFPSDLAKKMIADDLKILNEGKQVEIEEELNGRFYSTMKFPIIENGEPKYLAGYTIDITEQKQSEKKLNMQFEELRRWQGVMLEREGRVIELKKEVNALLRELGRKDKYGE